MQSRTHGIQVYTFPIALKFDKHIGSSATVYFTYALTWDITLGHFWYAPVTPRHRDGCWHKLHFDGSLDNLSRKLKIVIYIWTE